MKLWRNNSAVKQASFSRIEDLSTLWCFTLACLTNCVVALLCSLPWTVEDLELLLLLSNYGLRILLFLEGPAAVHELDTSSWNDREVLRVV